MHSPVQHVATRRQASLLFEALRKRRAAHARPLGERLYSVGCARIVMDDLQHRTNPRIGERCYRSAQGPALNLCSQDMDENHISQLVDGRVTTVYSKDWCPYCDRAKTLLASRGLEYLEIDVTNDTERETETS